MVDKNVVKTLTLKFDLLQSKSVKLPSFIYISEVSNTEEFFSNNAQFAMTKLDY